MRIEDSLSELLRASLDQWLYFSAVSMHIIYQTNYGNRGNLT